ncbi:hypothetical protein V6Z11_A12G286200 [Gossypium hirsutum]
MFYHMYWFYDAFASVFLRCSFKQAMLKKWNFLYLYMISSSSLCLDN